MRLAVYFISILFQNLFVTADIWFSLIDSLDIEVLNSETRDGGENPKTLDQMEIVGNPSCRFLVLDFKHFDSYK